VERNESEVEVMSLRKRGYLVPDFKDYADSLEWVKNKSKEYGGRNKFLSSAEFKNAETRINELYRETKKKQKSGYKIPNGFKVGMRVKKTVAGMFMSNDTVHGVCKMYKGKAMVKLDNEMLISKRGKTQYGKYVPYDEKWKNE